MTGFIPRRAKEAHSKLGDHHTEKTDVDSHSSRRAEINVALESGASVLGGARRRRWFATIQQLCNQQQQQERWR